MGCFVRQYKELLHSMYKQQILINHLNKLKTTGGHPLSLEVFQKQAKEKTVETKLLYAISEIVTYNQIVEKDVGNHIIKSIRL